MLALLACALLGGPLNLNELPTISPADLREDLRDFKTSLELAHAGIYRYSTRAQMDAKFAEAESKLSRPLTVLEFYRLLAPIETSIHCGHSGVLLPADLGKQFNSDVPEFPARIEILDKKLFILRDYSGNSLDGLEIESIKGIGTPEVLQRLSRFVPQDGTVKSSTPWRLEHGWGFNKLLVSALNLQSPYECVVRSSDGRRSTLTLSGLTQTKLMAQEPAKARGETASISFRQDDKIAVMKITEFSGDLEKFYNDAFAQIKAKGSTALILDLRDNGGGQDELGRMLFAHLTDQPFQYYKDLVMKLNKFKFFDGQGGSFPKEIVTAGKDGKFHATGHPNWGIQQPSDPKFNGKVFVLMNGGSFSTTGEFMSIAKEHHRATFIGEEGGAGFQGNNSGPTPLLVLRHSKIRFGVPLMRYDMAVTSSWTGGVMPDVPVHYTISDVMAGRDKEMEVAIKKAS